MKLGLDERWRPARDPHCDTCAWLMPVTFYILPSGTTRGVSFKNRRNDAIILNDIWWWLSLEFNTAARNRYKWDAKWSSYGYGTFSGSIPLLGAVIHHARKRSTNQGLYSLSGKTSYRKISWSLEAARFGFRLFQSLWNLTGTSAAALPRCLSNFRALPLL